MKVTNYRYIPLAARLRPVHVLPTDVTPQDIYLREIRVLANVYLAKLQAEGVTCK